MHGPISQNSVFYLNDASSLKKFWFQIISVKSVNLFGWMHEEIVCILQLPILIILVSLKVLVSIHSLAHPPLFTNIIRSCVIFRRLICKDHAQFLCSLGK